MKGRTCLGAAFFIGQLSCSRLACP
jgi:hypothetical protein